MTEKSYTDINMEFIGSWIKEGWEWGKPISHEVFAKARQGEWSVLLTPTKPVPKAWFPPMQGAKVLGLASGGGQQMPIFTALGAQCTVLDYSTAQLESEELVASRENYKINLVQAEALTLFSIPFPTAMWRMCTPFGGNVTGCLKKAASCWQAWIMAALFIFLMMTAT